LLLPLRIASVYDNLPPATSMVQSTSSEANTHSTTHGIPHILWNPKVHYRIHKSLSLVLILSQMNSTHNFQLYFPKVKVKLSLCFN
jgi:hypothetical protein